MPPKSKISKKRKQEKKEEILESKDKGTSETQTEIISQKTQEKPSNKNSESTERNQDTNKNNVQETNDDIQTKIINLLQRMDTKLTSLENLETKLSSLENSQMQSQKNLETKLGSLENSQMQSQKNLETKLGSLETKVTSLENSQMQSQKNLETKLGSLETKVTSQMQRSSDFATITPSSFYSHLKVRELDQWPNDWWLASKTEWSYSTVIDSDVKENKKAKNEGEIQKFWNEIAKSANSYTNKLVDHHVSPVRPLSYKPNLVIVPKELEVNSITAWNCIAFGELKPSERMNTNESKGQLLATMMTTLKTQFVRKSIAGFLSDGVKIQFWRVKKLDSSIFEYECVKKIYDLCGEGGKLLLGLLDSSVEDLGENIYFAKNPSLATKLSKSDSCWDQLRKATFMPFNVLKKSNSLNKRHR